MQCCVEWVVGIEWTVLSCGFLWSGCFIKWNVLLNDFFVEWDKLTFNNDSLNKTLSESLLTVSFVSEVFCCVSVLSSEGFCWVKFFVEWRVSLSAFFLLIEFFVKWSVLLSEVFCWVRCFIERFLSSGCFAKSCILFWGFCWVKCFVQGGFFWKGVWLSQSFVDWGVCEVWGFVRWGFIE